MVVTLTVLTDVYSKPDANGNTKLLKSDVEYKKMFETNGLLAEDWLSKRGVSSPKFCLVKEGENYFKLKHKFKEIEELIKPVKVR